MNATSTTLGRARPCTRTVRLDGVRSIPARKAEELAAGDLVVHPGGNIAEVLAIRPRGTTMLTLTLRSVTTDRTYAVSRRRPTLVGVAAGYQLSDEYLSGIAGIDFPPLRMWKRRDVELDTCDDCDRPIPETAYQALYFSTDDDDPFCPTCNQGDRP